MTEAASRVSLQDWLFAHAPAGWSGKMCPAYYRVGKELILPPSYRCSSDGKSPSPSGSGKRPESSLEPPDVSAWVGECLTLNIPEFNNFQGRSRSEGAVSSLSDVLIRGPVPPRYYLTVKCAVGILRRAANRGKRLPEILRKALLRILRSASGAESPAEERAPSSAKA